MVDERALEVACQVVPGASYDSVKAVIEAYEAARWRPIEEAPRNSDRCVIDWDGDGRGAMQVCWMERHIEERKWLNGYESIRETDFPNALFRTIDPPKQDVDSRATSTPPAAEASS